MIVDYDKVRRHKRAEGRFEVKCTLGESVGFEIPMKTLDASISGMRLLTARELLPGTLVNIIVNFKIYHKKLVTTAEVIWIKPYKYKYGWYETGIKFLKLNPNQTEMLEAFVKHHKTS